MADPCTKFEVSSVSRCGDFTWGVNFITGQLTLTTPLPGKDFFIGRVGLGMVSQCTKFEVSRFTHYEAMKKGKVFPYSLPSVGPGADPGVQAVSPQVT